MNGIDIAAGIHDRVRAGQNEKLRRRAVETLLSEHEQTVYFAYRFHLQVAGESIESWAIQTASGFEVQGALIALEEIGCTVLLERARQAVHLALRDGAADFEHFEPDEEILADLRGVEPDVAADELQAVDRPSSQPTSWDLLASELEPALEAYVARHLASEAST